MYIYSIGDSLLDYKGSVRSLKNTLAKIFSSLKNIGILVYTMCIYDSLLNYKSTRPLGNV